MKLENLPFALIVLLVVVLALAGIGWVISFVLVMDFNEAITDFKAFQMRLFLGLIVLGFFSGLSKLIDLFVYIMKEAPAKECK